MIKVEFLNSVKRQYDAFIKKRRKYILPRPHLLSLTTPLKRKVTELHT